LDIARISPDTCPLCRKQALRWDGVTCTCRSCGSAFEWDAQTHRCRYTYVSPAYPAATALMSDWLTRREVFERANAMAPAQSGFARAAAGSARAPAPLTAVWAVLVGALALIPILCACLSALLLSPGMAQTRQMIAAANAATATVVTRTVTGVAVQINATAVLTLPLTPISPLQSALISPTSPDGLPQEQPGVTAAGPTAPPTITVILMTPTPQTRTVLQPTATQQGAAPSTATLPATFTPAPTAAGAITLTAPPVGATPSATALVTAQPQLTLTALATGTQTLTPTLTPTGTLTGTPAATSTPIGAPTIRFSSTVVISNIMFLGSSQYNMADQWIELQNRGNTNMNLSNWQIDALQSGQRFIFTGGVVLGPNQVCRIYGNAAPTTSGPCSGMSFNSAIPVWNLTKDMAILRDSNNVITGTYEYGK
jgi:hypothetical protein